MTEQCFKQPVTKRQGLSNNSVSCVWTLLKKQTFPESQPNVLIRVCCSMLLCQSFDFTGWVARSFYMKKMNDLNCRHYVSPRNQKSFPSFWSTRVTVRCWLEDSHFCVGERRRRLTDYACVVKAFMWHEKCRELFATDNHMGMWFLMAYTAFRSFHPDFGVVGMRLTHGSSFPLISSWSGNQLNVIWLYSFVQAQV